MFHNKRFIKIASIILCFVIFFSFGSTTQAGFIKDMIDKGLQNLYSAVIKQISKMIVSLGDGVLHIVSCGTGEVVTIDKLVFNDVGKLSIDYWDDIDDSQTGSNKTPIKNFMSVPVKKWYKVFNAIALVVYLIVLVYIGIAVMLSSTGEKRAKYKELTVSWFLGIMILLMFPYVMKYIIMINDAMVDTLQAKASEMGYTTSGGSGESLADKSFLEMFPYYGEREFSDYLNADGDMMVMTRNAALGGKNDKGEEEEADITLAIVYVILIGQMLAILIMYYKRAFMIAFLITIFPLVGMTYVLDKIGDGKNQSFGIWFKEFVINVIVQMFHAVVYLLVTGAGIKSYIEGDGKNFIFMFLCVLFLFEGEKILREIFNVKSKANTMGDLATSGAMMYAMAKNTGGLFKRNTSDTGSAQDKNENSAAKNRIKSKTQSQKNNEAAAAEALDDKKEKGESTESKGEYQGKANEPNGVSTPQYDGENARDKVLMEAMKRRLKGGVATKAVNFGAGVVGAAMETSRVLADGYDKPGEVIGALSSGKKMGQTLATPFAKGVNSIERRAAGNALANKIKNGNMDKDLGIGNIGIPPVPPTMAEGMAGDIDLDQVANQGVTMQEVYKEALAAYAKAAARGGKAKGEIAYFKYLEKNLKK